MKKMLIIGAGGHGNVVAEIATALGYRQIAFLDDCSPKAIGRISDLDKFSCQFEDAFVGIGNNIVRETLLKKLIHCGYRVPVLVHPTAYVSGSAVIEQGTVVEPRAIVNANSRVGMGCILSVGSIVDHDVQLGTCCHINAGAIVKAGAVVENFRKLEAGEVVLGYQAAVVHDSR